MKKTLPLISSELMSGPKSGATAVRTLPTACSNYN